MGGDTERGAVVNDDLPDRLRVTAEEFEPDRDRMWSRVSDGMRETRAGRAEPVRSRLRVPLLAMATGAAVVLFGGIVLLGQTIGLGPVVDPTPEPPGVDPPTRTSGATTPDDEDPETSSSESATSTPTDDAESETGEETGSAGTDAPGDPEADWLEIDASVDKGSNDYWTQSNLVLENEDQLTAVTVELKVAVGAGVVDTGSYSTNNSRFTEAAVSEEGGFLVYRWSLQDGAVLPPGEYQFASQFTHDSARNADGDSYTITATNASGEDAAYNGGFR